MNDDRQAAAQSGADAFLSKPCREEELFETLRVHLSISYDYDDVGAASRQPAAAAPALSAEGLRQLPQDLLAELKNAISMYDYDGLTRLLEETQSG